MLSTNVPLAVGFSPLQILGGPLASPLGVLAVLVVLALVVLVVVAVAVKKMGGSDDDAVIDEA